MIKMLIALCLWCLFGFRITPGLCSDVRNITLTLDSAVGNLSIANEIIIAVENESLNIIIGQMELARAECYDKSSSTLKFPIKYIYNKQSNYSIIEIDHCQRSMNTTWHCDLYYRFNNSYARTDIFTMIVMPKVGCSSGSGGGAHVTERMKGTTWDPNQRVPRADYPTTTKPGINTETTYSISTKETLVSTLQNIAVSTPNTDKDNNSIQNNTDADNLEGGNTKIVAITAPLVFVIAIFIVFIMWYCRIGRKKRSHNEPIQNPASAPLKSSTEPTENEYEASSSNVEGNPQTVTYAILCDELMYSKPMKKSQRQILETEPMYSLPIVN